MKCYSCGQHVRREQACYGDTKTHCEGKPLCETCYYEDEPCATVYYGRDDTPNAISSSRNETEGDFWVAWHSTDPWRGYYETKSEKYSLVNTAELLAYHESEQMLKEFDAKVREYFNAHGVEYARVFARSSNVFYNNYDLYVRKGQELLAHLLVMKAKADVNYDDARWYRGIVFDEGTLSKLSQLFPERKIQTDAEAVKLVAELGDGAIAEISKRLKEVRQ